MYPKSHSTKQQYWDLVPARGARVSVLPAAVLGHLDRGALFFPIFASEGAETQGPTRTQSGLLAPGRRNCREWVEALLCASVSFPVRRGEYVSVSQWGLRVQGDHRHQALHGMLVTWSVLVKAVCYYHHHYCSGSEAMWAPGCCWQQLSVIKLDRPA